MKKMKTGFWVGGNAASASPRTEGALELGDGAKFPVATVADGAMRHF